ncbi:hypothetical protein AB0I06_34130 [Streptomyces sp. NPDC050674]|uniref:hypothetical protein n=1 Tax=Streptomyces sp. NPDC050674 TaxID=3157216 RepID=UPI00343427E2
MTLVLKLLGVGLVEAGEVAAEAEAEGADLCGLAGGFAEVGPVAGDGAEVGSGGGHRGSVVLVRRYGDLTGGVCLELGSSWARPFVMSLISDSLKRANQGLGRWLVVGGGRCRTMTNQPDENLTTAQAAKLLGVRTDTVHAMKTEGQLTVVGRGRNGTNLFAQAEVERLRIQRLKGHRKVPAQAELPSAEELGCDGCRDLRARAVAAEERAAAAEERAVAAEGRAERARAAMNAAVG